MRFGPPDDFIAPPLADVSHIKNKLLDIAYHNQSPAQVLDLYLPNEADAPVPVIVYIHGGGFALGNKRDGHISRLLDCLQRGYALAAVEYRLSGEAVFPAAVTDCRSAIRFLRANADKYGLDKTRFATLGGSAGGNLSAMMCAAADSPLFDDPTFPHGGEDCRVQAGVDWFGPTDFLVMDEQAKANGFSLCDHSEPYSAESCYLGGALPGIDPQLAAKANPISYVDGSIPPMLIEHGDSDRLVPPAQSQLLYDAIVRAAGEGRASLHYLVGADHEDAQFESPENMKLVWDFLDGHLKG